MSFGPGTMVGANVRLVRELGRGGMGSVWVADQLTLRTQVAVKFMSQVHAMRHDMVARFSREATAAAQIKSPHVVQTFDHGFTPDGAAYIVMELLEGEDLGRRMARVGRLGLDETVTIVVQAAKALRRAHALGIIHRDIKPENIFLTESDGEVFVKVLDFGIAKHEGDVAMAMTSSGMIVGTPYYMSPEQTVSSKHVDLRADLWSLAVVAYHALTAARPFDAESVGALVLVLDRAAFQPASFFVPTLGPSVDAWFTKALARNPDQRFGSAKEMADALLVAVRGTAFRPDDASASSPVIRAVGGLGSGTAVPAASGPIATFAGATVSSAEARRGRGVRFVALAVLASAALLGGLAVYFKGLGQPPPVPAGAADAPSSNMPDGTSQATAPSESGVVPASPSGSASVAAAPSSSASSASSVPSGAPSAKPASTPSVRPKPQGPRQPSSQTDKHGI